MQSGILCMTSWLLPFAPSFAAGNVHRHGPLRPLEREFLECFLPLRNRIPSHDTFSRVFRLLDPEAFQKWFLGFMGQFAQGCEGVLAIDGKTLRRFHDRAEAKSPLHLVNAWAAEQRLVLGQLAVDGKSNEITAVPKLLEILALPRLVVTADATHCQIKLSRQLLDQGADYVLALKGNQESLNDVVRLFLDDSATDMAQAGQTNKGYGRVETRTASISDDVSWLQERHQWPGLAAVGKITASRQEGGHTSVESRFYLLSQAFQPERVQPNRKGPLGNREPPALGAGGGFQRGPVAKPEGQQPEQSGPAPQAGAKSRPAGTIQRIHERQAETGRLGQQLPGYTPIPIHQNPNAIALKESPVEAVSGGCDGVQLACRAQ